MRTSQSPKGKPWFWTIFVNCPDGMNDRGYAASREEAIADFKVLWDNITQHAFDERPISSSSLLIDGSARQPNVMHPAGVVRLSAPLALRDLDEQVGQRDVWPWMAINLPLAYCPRLPHFSHVRRTVLPGWSRSGQPAMGRNLTACRAGHRPTSIIGDHP